MLSDQSVWRPLFGPLRDFPLAIGDFSTFDLARDGEPTDLVFPHYVGETIAGLVLLQVCTPVHKIGGDNPVPPLASAWIKPLGFYRWLTCLAAPHCSFDIQNGTYTERLRESIEVRLLVMYDE